MASRRRDPSEAPSTRPSAGVPPPRVDLLRRQARRAVQPSGPPTQPISVRSGGGDGIADAYARGVIDLSLRVGEALLSTGASAADVTATVLRLTAAYRLTSCHVDVTYTSITVSYYRGDDEDPMTVLRVVRVRSADYSRLEDLHTLVRDAAGGGLEVDQARARLDDVVDAPHPYRRWVVTLALACMAAAVTALLGGDWRVMALSAVTTAVIDRVQRQLGQWGLPAFFSQAVGAAIPTVVAVALIGLRASTEIGTQGLRPSLVVASGIIVLLAGLSLVGAAQDAIDGYYVTAGARGFEVLLMTLGIVVGIAAVLDMARRIGVPLEIDTSTGLSRSIVVQVVAASAVSGFFAASAYARPRAVLVSAVAGGLAWAVLVVAGLLGLGAAIASALAAGVVGVLSQLVAERLRVPALAVSVAGIVPLLPGLMLYRAMFELVEPSVPDPVTGFTTLLGAAGVGVGLAAGVSLGTFVARPLRNEIDRWQRRALRRATGPVD